MNHLEGNLNESRVKNGEPAITWNASLVLAKSKGYVHNTAVPPDAEPAKRSTKGPVPSEGQLLRIQHLYRSYAM